MKYIIIVSENIFSYFQTLFLQSTYFSPTVIAHKADCQNNSYFPVLNFPQWPQSRIFNSTTNCLLPAASKCRFFSLFQNQFIYDLKTFSERLRKAFTHTLCSKLDEDKCYQVLKRFWCSLMGVHTFRCSVYVTRLNWTLFYADLQYLTNTYRSFAKMYVSEKKTNKHELIDRIWCSHRYREITSWPLRTGFQKILACLL